ncbi:hypothetical protein BSKO_07139 [Bryopsis sp. KO-2023]|nr:hypothetical protein BSKO_07139 [Bryopsis sp. KO-2023]
MNFSLVCAHAPASRFARADVKITAKRVRMGHVVSARPERQSVNFTDAEKESDIFDLDKRINSALQWENVRGYLNARGGVMSVTKKGVQKLVEEEDYVCIDVRTRKSFEEGFRIPGAVNVPLFKGSDDTSDMGHAARQVFFTLLTSVEATYYNENFTEDVVKAVGGKDKPIVLACGKGGLIHESKYFPKGIASRSFIAAAILIKAGFLQVAHVNGGTGEKPKVNSMDRNYLLEFIYGTELPVGVTSPRLMMVSYTIVLGYLAYLIIPKLPQATIDFATRAGLM